MKRSSLAAGGLIGVLAMANACSPKTVSASDGAGGQASSGGQESGGGTDNGGAGGAGEAGGANATGGGVETGGFIGTGGTGTGGDLGAGGVGTGGDTTGNGGDPSLDHNTDAGSNNLVQPGSVCDRIATIQCASEQKCCPSPTETFGQCKANQLDACANKLYLDSVTENPISGYDPANAEATFAYFEQHALACDTTIAAWAALPTGLRGITAGTLAPGASCTPAFNINTDTYTRNGAAALASCTNPAGYACLPPSSVTNPWTCAARSTSGGPCFTDVNCVDPTGPSDPGLYCNGATQSPGIVLGTCTPRKADLAGCGAANECASLYCIDGQCAAATVSAAYCLSTN